MLWANRLEGRLVSIGHLTYTTLSLATDAFPLNIGFIAAYADKRFGKEIDLEVIQVCR